MEFRLEPKQHATVRGGGGGREPRGEANGDQRPLYERSHDPKCTLFRLLRYSIERERVVKSWTVLGQKDAEHVQNRVGQHMA